MGHGGALGGLLSRGPAEAGVGAPLIDVVGDRETARLVCHLDAPLEGFERSVARLVGMRASTVPHVLVGPHYGGLRALMAGVDAIALPSREGLRAAEETELCVKPRPTCCPRVFNDLEGPP